MVRGAWLNLFNTTCAYYYALLGETEKIPEVFRTHMLASVNILAPGRLMIEMIENQVYLAQGAYARVIGRSEGLLAMCGGMCYALVALHIRIQTAAAYELLGKRQEARELLEASGGETDAAFVRSIRQLGEEYMLRQRRLGERAVRPAVFAVLTEREYEIVRLMSGRISNREIAEKLFLSEGSVKQYVNQIYSKLHVEGDTRTKRKSLVELASKT